MTCVIPHDRDMNNNNNIKNNKGSTNFYFMQKAITKKRAQAKVVLKSGTSEDLWWKCNFEKISRFLQNEDKLSDDFF